MINALACLVGGRWAIVIGLIFGQVVSPALAPHNEYEQVALPLVTVVLIVGGVSAILAPPVLAIVQWTRCTS